MTSWMSVVFQLLETVTLHVLLTLYMCVFYVLLKMCIILQNKES